MFYLFTSGYLHMAAIEQWTHAKQPHYLHKECLSSKNIFYDRLHKLLSSAAFNNTCMRQTSRESNVFHAACWTMSSPLSCVRLSIGSVNWKYCAIVAETTTELRSVRSEHQRALSTCLIIWLSCFRLLNDLITSPDARTRRTEIPTDAAAGPANCVWSDLRSVCMTLNQSFRFRFQLDADEINRSPLEQQRFGGRVITGICFSYGI